MFVVIEGGIPENLEENPQIRERTNSKLNLHEMLGTGNESVPQSWEASAFPLCHLCSPTCMAKKVELLLKGLRGQRVPSLRGIQLLFCTRPETCSN